MAIGRAHDDLQGVYVFEFDLCYKYINDQGGSMRHNYRSSFRGTPRYASMNWEPAGENTAIAKDIPNEFKLNEKRNVLFFS